MNARVLPLLPLALMAGLMAQPAQSEGFAVEYSLQSAAVAGSATRIPLGSAEQLYRLSTRFVDAAHPEAGPLTAGAGFIYSTQINLTRASDSRLDAGADTDASYSISGASYQVGYGIRNQLGYQRVSVGFEQEYATLDHDTHNLWSLGLATGGGIPGIDGSLGKSLWQLSLRGQFDHQNLNDTEFNGWLNTGEWILSPSLHWTTRSFSLSARFDMPVDFLSEEQIDEPDYRLRANFQQRF